MRSFVFIALAVLVAVATGTPVDCKKEAKPIYDINDAPGLFEKYVIKYNKSYTCEADRQIHYEAFVKSLKEINKLNSNKDDTATYDLNAFSDYTAEERKKMFGYKGSK